MRAGRRRLEAAAEGFERLLSDIGFQQGAYDAECAAISRPLETAALRPLIAIYIDAQGAIRRMGPRPG
jgi:hypothetical protein